MSKNILIGSVGIDILDVSQITGIVKNTPNAIDDIFTPKEIANCQDAVNKYISFATIYAAKKAIIKSLGDLGSQVPLCEIEIQTHSDSQSEASLSPTWEQKIFPGRKLYIKLSLHSSKDFIVAQATIFTKRISGKKIFKKASAPSSGF